MHPRRPDEPYSIFGRNALPTAERFSAIRFASAFSNQPQPGFSQSELNSENFDAGDRGQLRPVPCPTRNIGAHRQMNRKALGAITVAVATAFIGMSYTIHTGLFEPELELSLERFYTIKADIKRATDDSVIMFGDSIVEGAPLPKLICGHAVINAGVTGAAIGYFERHAAELLGSAHPRLIVLAVGINNASASAAKRFRSHYYETVALLSRVSPVAVATITLVRSGAGSIGYDPALVPSLNAVISATPNVRLVIDVNEPLSSANFTTDGIHLGEAGYSLWMKAMMGGIGQILACARTSG